MLYQLLNEINQPQLLHYPYWLSHDVILERITPQILYWLQEIVKDTWRFDNVYELVNKKVTSDDFNHIGVLKRRLPNELYDEFDWNIRTIVLRECTSDDWQGVIKRIANLSCVTGLQMSCCGLTDSDLNSLAGMEHLERLSLGKGCTIQTIISLRN